MAEPKKSYELIDLLFYACAVLGLCVAAFIWIQPKGVTGLRFSVYLFYDWCVAMIFFAALPFAFATLASKNNPQKFRGMFITFWVALSAVMFFGRSS